MIKINSISVIDDDPIAIFGMKKMLSKIVDCNELHTYINGKAALDGIKEMLKENKKLPEVFFLDINMPIMDGWQFLQEFIALSIEQKVRINIVTSSIDRADYEKWEKYKTQTEHVITYNHKPITKEWLESITQLA